MRPDVVRKHAEETRDKRARPIRQAEAELAVLRDRARVDAARLTGHEAWDRYLAQVETLQARDRESLEALESRGRSTQYQSPEDIARARHEAVVLRARIEARDECARIPAELLRPDPA